MGLVRCKTCLYPTTKPDLAFVDGECSACVNYKKSQFVPWEDRFNELELILSGLPRNDSGYDVIVPSSGGKDSHYQVLKMIELGVRPLVVTATTCMLTDIGRKNIDNLARYATTIEVSPNKEVRKKLNRLGLKLVGDISLPEHMAIFSTPFKIAAAFGIGTIFYGECPQFEYGGPLGAEQAMLITRRWVSEYGGLLGMRASDFVGMEGITKEDMQEYTLPSEDAMSKISAFFLGQFIPWDSRRNAEIAMDHGMRIGPTCEANYWEFENLDNAQTGIHDHVMFRKYGYGRYCAQINVDIRRGDIARNKAFDMVTIYDGTFPHSYAGVGVRTICDHIGMKYDDMINTINSFTNKDLFSKFHFETPLWK